MANLLLQYLASRPQGATALEVARDVLALSGPPTIAITIAERALGRAGAVAAGTEGRWQIAGLPAAPPVAVPQGAELPVGRGLVAVVARTTGPRADLDQLFEIGLAIADDRGSGGGRRAQGGAVTPQRPLSDATLERFGLDALTLARGSTLTEVRRELQRALEGRRLVVWMVDSGASWLCAWLGVEPLELRPLAKAAGFTSRRLAEVAAALGVPVPSEASARAWAGALAAVSEALRDRDVPLDALPAPPELDLSGRAFGRDTLDALPDRPGVYRFLDAEGAVLYVGKARALRPRVWSYFVHQDGRRRRHGELVARAHRLEVEETGSELEALLTELRQIRELRPELNVQVAVHERRAVGGTFAIVLPGVAEEAVDVLFVRDGLPRGRATVDRRGRGMRALRRVMKEAVFAAEPPPGDPAEAQLVASWLLSARRTHPIVDLSEVTGIQEAARRLRACVTDPDLFREAVIHS